LADRDQDDNGIVQRMDALILRLLKTPPNLAEVAEAVRRAKGKATGEKRASARKRGVSA